MTIIHIVTSFMPGGAEMLVCDLANRQAETHRVHLLILHGKGDEALFISFLTSYTLKHTYINI